MIFDVVMARRDHVDRVSRQSAEMLIIASAATDDAMREELLEFARRLARQARCLGSQSVVP